MQGPDPDGIPRDPRDDGVIHPGRVDTSEGRPQIGAGTDWVWQSGQEVNPHDYTGDPALSTGVDMLRLLSGLTRIGFVVIDTANDGTVTETWRWARNKSFPATFQIAAMRETNPDDSVSYERDIRGKRSAATPIVQADWNAAFPVVDSFVWNGFADTTVVLNALPVGYSWRACTLGDTTLYIRLNSSGRPDQWYSTSSEDVVLGASDVMTCVTGTPLGKTVHPVATP